MIKLRNRAKKAQTALEYIAAALVFATVGIASFMAINQTALLSTMGGQDNYWSDDTLLGKTLSDNISQADYEWPEAWDAPPDQEIPEGALSQDLANLPAVQEADWSLAQEQELLAETGAGQYWTDSQNPNYAVNFPEVQDSYTASQLQSQSDQLTNEFLTNNQAGYTDEGMQEIQGELDKDWFMNPPEMESPPDDEE